VIENEAAIQLSVDHTYVQQLVERGEIAACDALSHPQAHVLTRALGVEPSVKVDTAHFWMHEDVTEDGDDANHQIPRWLLLCSDGLYSLVNDAEMAGVVSRGNPQDACVQLIEMARARGGFDNITVAVIPVPGALHKEPPPGYEAKRRAQLEARDRALSRPADRFAVFGAAGLLGLMASVLTLFWMIYRLSR